MRVAGIDPGLARTGFGVVDWTSKGPKHIHNSSIVTPAGMPQPDRLKMLHRRISLALTKFRPSVVVMERLYFSKNVKTATAVSQACGVILMSLAGRKLRLIEETPQSMKKALTSDGRASKTEVQKMVSAILGIQKVWRLDDEADALALALTYKPEQDFR